MQTCHMLTAQSSTYDIFALIELYGRNVQSVNLVHFPVLSFIDLISRFLIYSKQLHCDKAFRYIQNISRNIIKHYKQYKKYGIYKQAFYWDALYQHNMHVSLIPQYCHYRHRVLLHTSVLPGSGNITLCPTWPLVFRLMFDHIWWDVVHFICASCVQ